MSPDIPGIAFRSGPTSRRRRRPGERSRKRRVLEPPSWFGFFWRRSWQFGKMEEHTNMANVNETGEQPKRRAVTAESMAAKQRDISVSEFFAKNRHLLGFDNPRKALLTAVKEAVDNSLDACEEAGIVPEVWVHIEAT